MDLNNKKVIKYLKPLAIVFIPIIIVGFIISGYLLTRYNAKHMSLSSYVDDVYDDTKGFMYSVDAVSEFRDGHGIAAGSVVDFNGVSQFYNYGSNMMVEGVYNYMHLAVVTDKNVVEFATKLKPRTDVDDSINNGISYKNCGFTSYISKKNMQKYKDKELVITTKKVDGDMYILHTGKTLGEYLSE